MTADKNNPRIWIRNCLAAGVFALGFFAFFDCASAAPSVSGISGAVLHDATITVSGSGFGTKSPVAPEFYDPVVGMYTGLSNGSTVPTGEGHPWPNDGGFPTFYKTTNPRGKSTASYSNQWANNPGRMSTLGGLNLSSTCNRKMYVSWWFYQYSDISSNAQAKYTRFTPNGDWDIASFQLAPNGNISLYDFVLGYVDAGWDNTFLDELTLLKWSRMESFINGNSNPSPHIDAWLDQVVFLNKTANQTIGGDICSVGVLGADFSNDFGAPDTDFDWGEIYIDNTLARVEICNASTKAASTHCEIQIPQMTWNDGQLQITVNQGSFADDSSQYLYVADSTGTFNGSGRSITFGAGASDTTAPASPSGLSVT